MGYRSSSMRLTPTLIALLAWAAPAAHALQADSGAAQSLDRLTTLDPSALAAAMKELAGDPAVASAALDRLIGRGGEAAGTAVERRALAALVASDAPSGRVLDAVPLLADDDAAVRLAIVPLLARPDLGLAGRPERVSALARVGEDDVDGAVREAAIDALARIGGDESARILARLALRGRRSSRTAAARALASTPDGLAPLHGIVAEAAQSGAQIAPGVLAELLPRYGQWLADTTDPDRTDYAPLVFGLRHPSLDVRLAAASAFDRMIDRLVDSAVPGRASEVLGDLQRLGVERDVALYQRARIALAAEGDANEALAAADALVSSRGVRLRPSARVDAFESQLWLFRGLYLRGVAHTALGRAEDAVSSLASAADALDRALAERRDLLAEPERLRQVDLLHQRALVEVARALAEILRGAPDFEVLERARAAHRVHLEAQAVFAELEGNVTTGWDALLGTDLSVYRLLFGRRGFGPEVLGDQRANGGGPRPLDRSRLVTLQSQLGSALATVAPGELPGFATTQLGAAGEAYVRLTDPLKDPQRRVLMERIRDARLGGADRAIDDAEEALMRARDRAPSLVPEREIDALERLQRQRMAALRAIEQQTDGGDRWARDLRIPGSAGLWYARDLLEEGRGVEARAIAMRYQRDIEERGISDWWFYGGHERVARAQLLVGSSFTDDGLGDEAESTLKKAIERIEDIERQLRENGATDADLAPFSDMRSSALVSLAVNANVRLADPDKARRYYEQAYALRQDEFMRALLACYRARSGAVEEARALLRTIRPGPGTWYNLACTHALLGDAAEALEYLREDLELNHASKDSRDRQKVWAAEDPDLASLREDPRFRRLVRVD